MSFFFALSLLLLFPCAASAHDPHGLAVAIITGSLIVHLLYCLCLAAILTVVFRKKVQKKRQVFLPTFLLSFFLEFLIILPVVAMPSLGDSDTMVIYFVSAAIVATLTARTQARRKASQ